jgi:hypothetical protein
VKRLKTPDKSSKPNMPPATQLIWARVLMKPHGWDGARPFQTVGLQLA